MQRICLALAASKQLKAPVDDDLIRNVERYLRRAAEGARKFLPPAVGDRRAALGDRCDDDRQIPRAAAGVESPRSRLSLPARLRDELCASYIGSKDKCR